jgi:hypothetical protein
MGGADRPRPLFAYPQQPPSSNSHWHPAPCGSQQYLNWQHDPCPPLAPEQPKFSGQQTVP